jgi:FtsP/CotA-like multicopper oxidase with cupredoxin domain
VRSALKLLACGRFRIGRAYIALVKVLLVAGTLTIAVGSAPPPATAQDTRCAPRETAAGQVSAAIGGSLYCMDLVPIPELSRFNGLVELQPITAGANVSLTRDGHPRHKLVAVIDSLPPPASLGPFRAYVAWAATLSMDSVKRLGVVTAGRTVLGELQHDQFRLLITIEADANTNVPSGKLVLRGTSPGARLMAHRDVTRSGPLGNAPLAPTTSAGHVHSNWPMPPMDPRFPPMAGMAGLEPDVGPMLPKGDTASVPVAQPRQMLSVSHGDTIRLEAGLVRRRIAGRTFLMYGFNKQYPGPLIQVRQSATVHVDFSNALDQPSTIHWHGIRLDNRFDGVPHLTQHPVAPGGRFLYTVHFPDAGIYWYHSHYREEIQQDLGLYGNILVGGERTSDTAPVNRSEILMLDDLLINDAGLIPFGVDTPTHALMGRFGNVFLVNGERAYNLEVDQGEVVRFYLTNVANARPFNVSFGGARMKLVGSDVGRYEREEWIESVVLAPAERIIVDVLFDRPGDYVFANRIQALNHAYGTYYSQIDTLGLVRVRARPAQPDLRTSFQQLRTHTDVVREIDPYRSRFAHGPDRELILSMRVRDVPSVIAAMATGYPVAIDWNDSMGMMNWATTGNQITWVVRDPRAARENMDVSWTFRRGERVRLRVFNDPNVFHAMAHPIHIHGQRLLVIGRNGVPVANHAWKDTALIQAGETVELLVEMNNPGRWMLHCHIAEHLGSGMMMVFEVTK